MVVLSVDRIMGNAITGESAVNREDNGQMLSLEKILGKCCHLTGQ